MGSRLSRAVTARPQPDQATSRVIAQDSVDQPNATHVTPHIPEQPSHDDIGLRDSRTPPITVPRRYSEPLRDMNISAPPPLQQPESLEAAIAVFRSYVPPPGFATVPQVSWDSPIPPPPGLPGTMSLPPDPLPFPPKAIEYTCLICCTLLGTSDDAEPSDKIFRPCEQCENPYCKDCIKNMFVNACNDMSLMPPRCCCIQFPLHVAKRFLTKDEIQCFKEKYEEWSTPQPFYCPVPTCSVFIPDRLLPWKAISKGKQRVDSGVGTPVAKEFDCHKCQANICADCRQVAHPGSICNIGTEFGVDKETEELLKSWGYKKCPKCGHGVRRMYGCSHMECRCGAHFCWVCLSPRDQCVAGCIDDDEGYSDDESDGEDQAEPATEIVVTEHTELTESPQEEEPTDEAETEPSASADTTTTPHTTPPPVRRAVNLDRGSHRRWEDADLDFGREPGDGDIADRTWQCRHVFSVHKIDLKTALTQDNTEQEMECMKCWTPIHSEIITHPTADTPRQRMTPAFAGRGRITRGRGRGRGRYAPPRGLFRADATVGTAPHLTATISLLSQSLPAREAHLMEDIRYSERVIDTYGNTITTSEMDFSRRASFSQPNSQQDCISENSTQSAPAALNSPIRTLKSTLFDSQAKHTHGTAEGFSFAHECRDCGLFVCLSCLESVGGRKEEFDVPINAEAVQEHDDDTDDDGMACCTMFD